MASLVKDMKGLVCGDYKIRLEKAWADIGPSNPMRIIRKNNLLGGVL